MNSVSEITSEAFDFRETLSRVLDQFENRE